MSGWDLAVGKHPGAAWNVPSAMPDDAKSMSIHGCVTGYLAISTNSYDDCGTFNDFNGLII